MANRYDQWLQEARQVCDSLGPAVGEATGKIYGFGVETLPGGFAVSDKVEQIIGDHVTEHWGSVCDLPSALASASETADRTVRDAVGPTIDTSIAPDF